MQNTVSRQTILAYYYFFLWNKLLVTLLFSWISLNWNVFHFWVKTLPLTLLRVFTFNLVFCFLFNFFLLKSFLLLKKTRKAMRTKELNSLPYPMVSSRKSRGKNVRSPQFYSPKQREPTQGEFQSINQNIKYFKTDAFLMFHWIKVLYSH